MCVVIPGRAKREPGMTIELRNSYARAAYGVYCSGARQMVRESPHYKSLELPPALSVGPEYGLTVSRKAAPGAADFAMYLLSPQGQASLKSFGFIPVALPDTG